MTLFPTARDAGSPYTSPGNLWSLSPVSRLLSGTPEVVPQDPGLRSATYWGFNALPLLITFWKFIILPLNLCFTCKVPWCNGACPGAWHLSSQGSHFQSSQHLQPTQPPPFNLPPSDSCHPLPLRRGAWARGGSRSDMCASHILGWHAVMAVHTPDGPHHGMLLGVVGEGRTPLL